MTPDKDLELDAYRAREGAEVTLAQLLYLFQAPAISSVFYAVKGRVKTVVGILDKVNRKRSGQNPRPDYCPTDITDVVGIRVITLFRDDIIEALKIVLKLIKQHTPSPFIKDKLHEAIIYTSVAEGDPEAINARVKDVLKAFGYSDICVVRQAPTQYSSIHLLAFCPREGEREIAVEIQIRTVFEDAWGEIDHKLRYSNDRGHAQTERMNWQPHLNVLKTFVDGCGQYAGMIKRQALAPALPYFSSGTVPVDTAIEAFAQMGVIPAEIKASFEAAYQMRDGASAEKDITAKKSLFLDGGNLFLALAGSIEVATFDSVEARAKALFFAKMEAGFCLLATEEREKIAAAINIYAEAESRYPNDPIPLYRHAVALSELNEFETAEAKYSQAQDALDNDTTIPAEHWLRQALPRRRGFLHWLMANECANDEKGIERRKALLERACELTRNALSLSQAESLGEFRSGNNLLYYLLDLNYGNSSENVIVSPELNRCIGILESRFSVATAGRDRLSELDTLCRAYAMMGRFAEAVLAAERIENALANAAESSREIGEAKSMPLASAYYSITENLNPAERRILDHALWVLRNYGPGREGEETSG